jgi:hypothetical protein
VRGQAALVRIEPPQKIEPQLAPHPDFNEILHSAKAGAQNQKQDFPQWIKHPPTLPGILQRRKMIDKADRRARFGHQGLRFVEAS